MYEWFPRIVYTHEVKPRSHSARKALHAESRPPGLRFQEFWGEGAGAVCLTKGLGTRANQTKTPPETATTEERVRDSASRKLSTKQVATCQEEDPNSLIQGYHASHTTPGTKVTILYTNGNAGTDHAAPALRMYQPQRSLEGLHVVC